VSDPERFRGVAIAAFRTWHAGCIVWLACQELTLGRGKMWRDLDLHLALQGVAVSAATEVRHE
jgi:hypothetical protein